MKSISTLAALLALALAAPASAGVQVEGTGEPAFTKSATNTQWVRWQSPGSVDGYRLHVRYFKDSVQVHELRLGTPMSGTAWIDWAGVQTLEEGHTYAICVRGEYQISGMWWPDGASSCESGNNEGKRTSTTIDRTAPTIAVAVAGGSPTTRQASIPVHIDFEDALAGPYPANYVCLTAAADPAAACGSSLALSAACSQPNQAGRVTSFDCQLDAANLPDGTISACVVAADAAQPDNATNPSQIGAPSSANHSAIRCDSVVLDRVAPTLTVQATATTATVGQAIGFTATASDATSGVAGEVEWTWADGTAKGSGSAQSHTFSQPGTYEVQARVSDAAGHETLETKTITVTAAPAGGDPGGDPAKPGDGQTPGDGGAKDPVPPAGPTIDEISKAAGGAAVVRTEIGAVTLLVPTRFRIAKLRRHLVIGVATKQAGSLSMRLVRGRRVVAQRVGPVAVGGTAWRLVLPRKLRTGRYALKVAFTPPGADRPTTMSARINIKARKR